MLKKRFIIVAIMTLIVFAMMLFIDFSHYISEKEETQKELVQKESVQSCENQSIEDSEC